MPDTETVFAAEGSFAHDISEIARIEGKPAKHYIGVTKTYGEFEFTLSAGDAAHIQTFIDFCEEFDGDAFYEERVSYDDYVEGGFGTMDDARIDDEGVCAITDLKFGKGVAKSADQNPQNRLYALGVLQEFGALYDIKSFLLNICQPRLGIIEQEEVTITQLMSWVTHTVIPAAEAAEKPDADFNAGPWCQFCKIKATCKTRSAAIDEIVLDEMNELRGLNEMTNDDLGTALDWVDNIAKWCKDVKEKALSLVQKGEVITGDEGPYKIVAGRSNRKWKNEDDADKALTKAKVKAGDRYTKKLVSVTQAEGLLGKDHELFKDQVVKPQGKPVLVPGSDGRADYKVAADDEMQDLDSNSADA
jgi:hypothetical protein